MRYRQNPKNNDSLSQLGLGCMRFARRGGRIIQSEVNRLVAAAIDIGVNYFDTAYIYLGSEEALGAAIATSGRRDQIKIATKLPHYMCRGYADFDRFFIEQLRRLNTDRIDYYLMHMLNSPADWARLIQLGILDWLDDKRRDGRIINAGFSFHGGRQAFDDILTAHDWDFCMVQYNYMDRQNQAGYDGVKKAHGLGLPVFAMEPLRGGFLANGLPDKAMRAFAALGGESAPAHRGLKWVWNHPEITLALSGMSGVDMLMQNAACADESPPGCLSEAELDAYETALEAIGEMAMVGCTGCGYCMPCPQGVDIPTCFSCYNSSRIIGRIAGLSEYYKLTGATAATQTDASRCVGCKLCEKRCPQGIAIASELQKVNRRMMAPAAKPIISIARKAMRIK